MMENNLKEITENIKVTTTLKYLNNTWVEIKDPKNKPLLKNEISFITYNVWFEDFNWESRLNAISKCLESYFPDFICLQEVTQSFLDHLMSHEFVQQNYYISGNFKNGYDVLILSRFETIFYTASFPSRMGRNLLFTVLKTIDSKELAIGTSHFESLQNEVLRKKQFQISFHILTQFPYAFLMGDFNFDPSWKEQENLDRTFSDSWKEYCKLTNIDELTGYTMPANKYYSAWRPDRLLYKPNEKIRIKFFEIFGKNKIIDYPEYVETPSDHYGLYGVYSYVS